MQKPSGYSFQPSVESSYQGQVNNPPIDQWRGDGGKSVHDRVSIQFMPQQTMVNIKRIAVIHCPFRGAALNLKTNDIGKSFELPFRSFGGTDIVIGGITFKPNLIIRPHSMSSLYALLLDEKNDKVLSSDLFKGEIRGEAVHFNIGSIWGCLKDQATNDFLDSDPEYYDGVSRNEALAETPIIERKTFV